MADHRQSLPDLVLPLKAVYFDQIAASEKGEEYRLITPYWRTRLQGKTFRRIVLTKGYPKADDHSRRLVREWRGYRETVIQHPHFNGGAPADVFAIDVSVPHAGALSHANPA